MNENLERKHQIVDAVRQEFLAGERRIAGRVSRRISRRNDRTAKKGPRIQRECSHR